MPKLKLTYFDPRRTRRTSQTCPLDWQDPVRRRSRSTFRLARPQTQHPVRRFASARSGWGTLAQSNAINRYVGKLTDLYPQDPWQAALCDEVMEAVEDINTKLAATFFLPEEEKKTQRKVLVEGPLPFYLTRLQHRLEAHGGRYFAADRP